MLESMMTMVLLLHLLEWLVVLEPEVTEELDVS